MSREKFDWPCFLVILGAIFLVWAVMAAYADARPATAVELRAQLAKERQQYRTQLKAERANRAYTARQAIALAALSYDVPHRTLLNVARCESQLDPKVTNSTPIYNGEHAMGLFQFIPSTWSVTPYGRAGFSVFNPVANALGAAWLMEKDGLRQWHCKANGIPGG